MTTTYYIKAYFTKPGQNQHEIRRFAIDISSENDAFQELQTKIASFQLNNDFTLQYLDEENERITFSSNDELRSAVALNKDANTLKVFITLNQSIPQQQQQETKDKELHPGVQCDGCQGSIRGFRYKCFVCPNYDLCETCSAAGIHSEHNMIKITRPGNFHYPNGPYPHPHPHPHPHHMPPPPPPPSFPGREFMAQVQSQIPQWLPNGANAAHFRTHLQQHLDSIKTNTQTHVQNSKQYLENVGQYLQQTLSPFGIDCDYHVDERNSTTNQEQQSGQASATQQQEQTSTAQAEGQTSTAQTGEQTSTAQAEEQTSTNNTDSTREPDAVPKYPDLTSTMTTNQQSTPISDPIEKAIDDCLEQMQAMGFIDVNGRLRELIRSKQGEMNAVLDAINPRHYQS